MGAWLGMVALFTGFQMKITSVRVNCDLDRGRGRKDNGQLIAFASIVFDGEFVVSHIRIIKNETGKIVVSMPSRQSASGQYRDLAYPITSSARERLDAAVIAELKRSSADVV